MTENSTEAAAETASAVAENHPANLEPAAATVTENDVSEPPTKKAKAEPRKSRTPHKSVDQLLADEAKAVCGDVDTSSGRQLRKREPPPAKPETKKPAARTSTNKKEPTPKKESTGKRGRPSTKSKAEDEENNDKEASASTAENSTDEKHKEGAVEGDKNGADESAEHKEEKDKPTTDEAKHEMGETKTGETSAPAPTATTDASQTTAGGGGDSTSPPKAE